MLSLPTSPETVSSPGWPRRLTTLGHGRDAASTDRDDGDGHEDQRQVGNHGAQVVADRVAAEHPDGSGEHEHHDRVVDELGQDAGSVVGRPSRGSLDAGMGRSSCDPRPPRLRPPVRKLDVHDAALKLRSPATRRMVATRGRDAHRRRVGLRVTILGHLGAWPPHAWWLVHLSTVDELRSSAVSKDGRHVTRVRAARRGVVVAILGHRRRRPLAAASSVQYHWMPPLRSSATVNGDR
jgi:hypothetical protein